MSACLAIDGQPFGLMLLDAFRLAGEQMTRIRKVLPQYCSVFLKNARAFLTLAGKSLMESSARMVGSAEVLKDMVNAVGCTDLPRPPSKIGRLLSSVFGALRR